jgi:hypothetical protein
LSGYPTKSRKVILFEAATLMFDHPDTLHCFSTGTRFVRLEKGFNCESLFYLFFYNQQ